MYYSIRTNINATYHYNTNIMPSFTTALKYIMLQHWRHTVYAMPAPAPQTFTRVRAGTLAPRAHPHTPNRVLMVPHFVSRGRRPPPEPRVGASDPPAAVLLSLSLNTDSPTTELDMTDVWRPGCDSCMMRNIDLFGNYEIPRRTATQAFSHEEA